MQGREDGTSIGRFSQVFRGGLGFSIGERDSGGPPGHRTTRPCSRALEQFLEDGRLPLDNTAAERALRGIAVGRNNWLFAGNDASGEWAAIMYSLIRTCELNGVEPWAYLRSVLTRIAGGWPHRRLAELLPHNWSPDDVSTAV